MRIRGELDAVASKAEQPAVTQSFAVGDHVARYTVDPERRLLILVEVTHR
ncbi:hypothetical protein [Vitiosangium sp. GDMCC 1.1324]|nr:hypothetical protein [Vitiosangium sp. GDMCC 1.1324]